MHTDSASATDKSKRNQYLLPPRCIHINAGMPKRTTQPQKTKGRKTGRVSPPPYLELVVRNKSEDNRKTQVNRSAGNATSTT
mmetsp:Transcript_54745/g.116329  ORF Transcript_54745/g.116329 Transcript_54745/m.116329 type:complete len:82 (-) Transcript_54745:29-274(-)